MSTRLRSEFVLVGYFLSRCGDRTNETDRVLPPSVLGTRKWKKAYAIFFSKLGSDRSLRSFINALKNTRDAFDGWVVSGRRGWRAKDRSGEPRPLGAAEKRIYERWRGRSEEDLWNEVKQFADLAVRDADSRVISDLEAELEPDEVVQARTEGGRRVVISSRVERDPRLRSDAIKLHGTKCIVCGFDFAEVYGEWGVGFIEVHHVEALGASERVRETDPLEDLTVLCANCHRMVHRRRNQVLDIEELRQRINIDGIRRWANSLSRRGERSKVLRKYN